MEKHFLLLLLGLSLVVGFLHALTCLQCDLLNADGKCEKGESTCEAKDDQECAILVVSKGYDIWFGQQDCSTGCFNKTFTHYNITLDFTCCHDQSLCNEF
ncbi:secreted seminal-vesicle Ly-6 protein 1-like [Onychomys torridus]|uniref:secreted seminal-vesicle Ly-6 protein 1-like n=1 Tax=Onychomys torridus TaxID=38674 RepID=UPI00167F393B|nr:secreted seminal-vesicle Ly-6 protein 1-like [Onychomys torridus]